jgi:hypothetical protein
MATVSAAATLHAPLSRMPQGCWQAARAFAPATAAPHQRLPSGPPPAGENPIKDDYNAIHVADTPCTDGLKAVPGRWRTIRAHGKAVGLPSDDDMGNSEVGL